MPMPSGVNSFPAEFYCFKNGVRCAASPDDLRNVGASGRDVPRSIKKKHRESKRTGPRASADGDGDGDGTDNAMDVDGNPNGNLNPIRRITFD